MDAFWIIIVGYLVAATSGLLGSLLVLRKSTMIGDAISHSVLPGIVIGTLFTREPNQFLMMLGAVVFGLIATLLISTFTYRLKIQQDASIGVVYTVLFSLGIILISRFAQGAHLDQDCVLYGEIAYVAFEEAFVMFGMSIPYRVFLLFGVFLFTLTIMILGYKAWIITTFDASYARALGFRYRSWDILLMLLVALNTAVSFESVGSILVISFLVLPPVSAYLLSKRLREMWVLTLFFAVLPAVGGYYLSVFINTSISATMALFAALDLFIVLICVHTKNRFLVRYRVRKLFI